MGRACGAGSPRAASGQRGRVPGCPSPGGGPAPLPHSGCDASSGARRGQIVPGAFPALGGPLILLCAGVGGEPDGCCDLRFWAGWGRVPPMIPRWQWSWEALCALGGSGWVAGSWGGQGKPREASPCLGSRLTSPSLGGSSGVPSGPCFLPRELWAPAAAAPRNWAGRLSGGLSWEEAA